MPSKEKTILIVDDDPLIARMYERKLIQEGFHVVLARDGEEGLKAAEDAAPDLILLDVLMPKLNGWEVLKALKKNEKTEKIPVIVLTSLGDRLGDIEKFKEAGAKEYLVKSDVDLREFVETVRTHIA